MLKEKTMCVGDLVSNREFDVNCNFDIYDCTKPGADWTDDANVSFLQSKMDGLNLPMMF